MLLRHAVNASDMLVPLANDIRSVHAITSSKLANLALLESDVSSVTNDNVRYVLGSIGYQSEPAYQMSRSDYWQCPRTTQSRVYVSAGCPSHLSTTAAACSRFAAERPAGRRWIRLTVLLGGLLRELYTHWVELGSYSRTSRSKVKPTGRERAWNTHVIMALSSLPWESGEAVKVFTPRDRNAGTPCEMMDNGTWQYQHQGRQGTYSGTTRSSTLRKGHDIHDALRIVSSGFMARD